MATRNINQNWNNQIGGNLFGFGQGPNQGIASASMNVPQDMRKYFSDPNQMVYPGQRNIHEGFGTADVSSSFPAPEKRGIDFSRFTGPITGIIQGIKDQFQYKGAQGEAFDPSTGEMISAEDQDKMNALGGYYSEPARYDRRQRKRVTDMLARQKAGKDIGDDNLKRLLELGYGPEKVITDTVTDVTRPGEGGGSQQTFTQTSPAGISQAQSRAARGGMSGWRLAQGGRAGYQGGELVEQETDFIQGPQGGEEFQETVVEGQEQPSREQLEALAMEIFQLPLEELDEQQLVVVYQTAMQGQPMEEAVQEEDVQFAANGGLAGLL